MDAAATQQKYVRSPTAHAPKWACRWLGSSLYASTPLARALAKPAAKQSQKHAADWAGTNV